jgi:hypothetical protein
VSSVLCCFIFVKMFNSGHMTNFVVVHTVWILLVTNASYTVYLMFNLTDNCYYWHVHST